MEWNDHGLVIGVRRHGETSAIAELMTRDHGRALGLVRGGRSRKMRPLLQVGNLLSVNWRARLDEHLGYFQLEPEKLRAAALMANRSSLYCAQILAAHLRLLPERDVHKSIFAAANVILDHCSNSHIAAHLVSLFEVALLEELGFGLSLDKCVVSGSKEDLIWVSPKSGGAVCRREGLPWAEKLLALPQFLRRASGADGVRAMKTHASVEDLCAGMRLTGYFLDRNVYQPRALRPPDERVRLVAEVTKGDD